MPYKAEIYQGKNVNDDSGLPLGYRVVISSLSPCETPQKQHVFFDNFFSSYVLLVKLKEDGFRATSTFREDRTAQCPLMLKNKMKKEERGTIDFRSSRDGIELIHWNDNSVVMIGSNTLSVEPIYQCKRLKRGAGQVKVSQPAAIKEYNDGMGGVDLVDRALSDYRPVIQGKKWYWNLLVNALNLGMVYCWRLFELCSGKKVPQKNYRRVIVQILLQRGSCEVGRPGPSYSVPDEVRLDNIDHYPGPGSVTKCVICKKNCRNVCMKCKKSVHVKFCFQVLHEK